MVSFREWGGYKIDALWDFGPGEPERYVVTVTRPDGSEVGEWTVTRGNDSECDLEAAALGFGEKQAVIDWEEQDTENREGPTDD